MMKNKNLKNSNNPFFEPSDEYLESINTSGLPISELKEKIADYMQRRWSHWINSACFLRGYLNENGSFTMTWSKETFDYFEKLSRTDYKYLPEKEKENCNKEANKIIMLILNGLRKDE
jgi:hypothetical protein